MRVLVACEFSGTVRRAFRALGHDAWSCDILEAEDHGEHHHQGDVTGILSDGWDLMIAHPPCTHLAVSGARWFPAKRKDQDEAIEFVRQLMNAPIDRIAIENPVSIISTRLRPGSSSTPAPGVPVVGFRCGRVADRGGHRVSACEWCGRIDGHENGCRLGLGLDEIAERQPCCPCGLKTRPGSCGWCEE